MKKKLTLILLLMIVSAISSADDAPSPEQVPMLSDKEISCLETVIQNETGGDHRQGAIEVGATVFNRVRSPQFPKTICAVAYQPKQFSNIKAIRPSMISARAKSTTAEIIQLHYEDALPKNILFFHADYVTPNWAHRLKRIIKKGNHIFYAK